MQAGRELGMHTMDQHLADLVNEGKITREAAFEKAHDPETLDAPHPALGLAGAAGHARSIDEAACYALRQSRDAADVDGGQELRTTPVATTPGKVVKGKLEAPSEARRRSASCRAWGCRR